MNPNHARLGGAALAASAILCGPWGSARAEEPSIPDIPFARKVLGNGLTVVVHEDHKAPVVAVNVYYHVGSKNERPGRTGFAHLFEHLMFNGSEHANDDWFQAMSRFGATGVNGTTNEDRTNYFETVPTGALDATLWLESDRMGHLVGAIDQAKLDEQRGVVQNEKRQNENRPYSAADRMLPPLLYPSGHPYSWQVIGSMADLDSASLDDVKQWFRAYYGAANALVVICGDVDAADAVKRVEHFFGDIPPGPPVERPEAWIAKRTGTTRVSVEERVPQPRLLLVWNTPGWGHPDTDLLELAASVLARGENSRLRERLVRKEGLATAVSADVEDLEIAGQFAVTVTAAAGADVTKLERVLDEELASFLASGPTAEELELERAQYRAQFLRRTERVGGFGGKSGVLAYSELFGGRPDAWKDRFARTVAATPEAVKEAASRWLSDGRLVLETRPFAKREPAKAGADRSSMPAVKDAGDPRFPALERTQLANGLRVVLARRPAAEIARLDLLVDAGFAADPLAAPGTAHLVGATLTSGTANRSATQIRQLVDRLGADLEVATETDTTHLSMSMPRDGLAQSIDLVADVVLRPSFPDDELEVERRAQLSAIDREHVDGRGMVQRVLPRLLYGDGTVYSSPSTGTGTAESVAKLSREDLSRFHGEWFRPGSVTLVVTGDVAMTDVQPLVEKSFGAWPAGQAPSKKLPAAASPGKSHVYLMDRPGAPQSVVVCAQLVPPRGAPEETQLSILNTVLGGNFVSRINMNLREDKHWSYGARSDVRDVRGPRPLTVSASVQTDKTAESLAEMVKEMKGIAGGVPPTAAEIGSAKSSLTLTLPGRWEATRGIAELVAEIVTFGLPDTYFDGYASKIRAVPAADVAAAGALIHPDELVWIVVGDRRKVEQGVRALGVGEVTVIDADGRSVE